MISDTSPADQPTAEDIEQLRRRVEHCTYRAALYSRAAYVADGRLRLTGGHADEWSRRIAWCNTHQHATGRTAAAHVWHYADREVRDG